MSKPLLICLLALALLGATHVPSPRVATTVGAIGLTVRDVDASATFFQNVFGFERVFDVEAAGRDVELLYGVFGARVRIVRMQLGDEQIELTQFVAPPGREYPSDTRANDRWFQHIAIITSDMDAAYARLRANGLAHASTAPQRLPEWNVNAAGIEAFYFRDPDGHFLETLAFPPGKGDPKWQRRDRLFLGIDHTAIVSGHTDRSLVFYRDGLGLQVVGGSENYGVEQEHLNGVFGARLRITTLRASGGPAVELLEYLTPRDGRPAPLDLKSNDIAHWHTSIISRGIDAFLRSQHGGWLVSPIVVPRTSVVPNPAMLVRDPDGHGIRLVDRQ